MRSDPAPQGHPLYPGIDERSYNYYYKMWLLSYTVITTLVNTTVKYTEVMGFGTSTCGFLFS